MEYYTCWKKQDCNYYNCTESQILLIDVSFLEDIPNMHCVLS